MLELLQMQRVSDVQEAIRQMPGLRVSDISTPLVSILDRRATNWNEVYIPNDNLGRLIQCLGRDFPQDSITAYRFARSITPGRLGEARDRVARQSIQRPTKGRYSISNERWHRGTPSGQRWASDGRQRITARLLEGRHLELYHRR